MDAGSGCCSGDDEILTTGGTGRDFNRRKRREGAFWRDRYHPKLVENGDHLSRCLFYIDLNMVRAGAVEHPGEWRCCGYHELSGLRQRYRIVNKEQLLGCLGRPCAFSEFDEWYHETLNAMLIEHRHRREPQWTECVAVGTERWIDGLTDRTRGIRQEIVRWDYPKGEGVTRPSYGLKLGRRVAQGIAADLAEIELKQNKLDRKLSLRWNNRS